MQRQPPSSGIHCIVRKSAFFGTSKFRRVHQFGALGRRLKKADTLPHSAEHRANGFQIAAHLSTSKLIDKGIQHQEALLELVGLQSAMIHHSRYRIHQCRYRQFHPQLVVHCYHGRCKFQELAHMLRSKENSP